MPEIRHFSSGFMIPQSGIMGDSVKNKFFTNELIRFANIVLTHCEQSSH